MAADKQNGYLEKGTRVAVVDQPACDDFLAERRELNKRAKIAIKDGGAFRKSALNPSVDVEKTTINSGVDIKVSPEVSRMFERGAETVGLYRGLFRFKMRNLKGPGVDLEDLGLADEYEVLDSGVMDALKSVGEKPFNYQPSFSGREEL